MSGIRSAPAALGKYQIRGVLGRDAMGTVYDGWDPVIGRRVAIKTVRLLDPDDAEAHDAEQGDHGVKKGFHLPGKHCTALEQKEKSHTRSVKMALTPIHSSLRHRYHIASLFVGICKSASFDGKELANDVFQVREVTEPSTQVTLCELSGQQNSRR
jgi:hypothetical protein